jgi:hypothetical protein
MPVIETVLIYGVIPLAVFVLLAIATLLPGRGREHPRYRPGQPWTAEPLWYEPHPEAGHGDAHEPDHHEPGPGQTLAALTIGEHPHGDDAPRRTAAGGARGTW